MSKQDLIALRHEIQTSGGLGDYERFSKWATILENVINADTIRMVRIPETIEEARMQALLGTNYLLEHAPELLKNSDYYHAALVRALEEIKRYADGNCDRPEYEVIAFIVDEAVTKANRVLL